MGRPGRDARGPVRYDELLNEFWLDCGGRSQRLVYCFNCGRLPESLRGRAYSAYNGARNAAELGALVAGGVLVGAIGARAALLIAGAVPLAIGAIALGLATARSSLQIQQVQRRPQHAHHEG